MNRNELSNKLKSGALPMAIGVLGLISVFVLIIFTYNSSHINFRSYIHHHKLLYAYSDQALLKAATSQLKNGEIIQANGFRTLFKKGNHGLFELLELNTFKGNDTLNRFVQMGYEVDSSMPQLHVVERNQQIRLIGKGSLKGIFSLPVKGFSKTSLFDKTFEGKLNPDRIINSSRFFPKLSHLVEKRIVQLLENQSLDSLFLKELPLVYSLDSIVIGPQDDIEANSVVIAPKIKIMEGVNKPLQLFAKDSIIVERGVILKYPSAVALSQVHEERRQKGSLVQIGEGSKVLGLIVVLCDERDYKSPPNLELLENAEVFGRIYNQGSTRHEGKLNGWMISSSLHGVIGQKKVESVIYNGSIEPLIDLESPFLLPRLLLDDKNLQPKSIQLL